MRLLVCIALAGAMLFAFQCKKEAPHQGNFPDHSGIPGDAAKLRFRDIPQTAKDFPYQYQADYRGDFPGGGDSLSFWFARLGHSAIRMDFLLTGKVGDSMIVHAPNKSDKEVKCRIEDVKNRIGCTLKIESDADVYLITIKQNPDERKERPVEFYVNIKSRKKMVFMR